MGCGEGRQPSPKHLTQHLAGSAARAEGLSEGQCLVREGGSKTVYTAHGEPPALCRVARLATVRNLAARGLVDWDGGAFDPERRAVISELGRFVLAKGRPGSQCG